MTQLSCNASNPGFEIEQTILSHPAWHGLITGLRSEALLKDKAVYSFLLRRGEENSHYYISYVDQDLLIRHQPFAIIYTGSSWYCRQGVHYGPFTTQAIEDLIYRIMHCSAEDCKSIPSN